MPEGDARHVAFSILRRVDQEDAFSSVLLQHIDDEGLHPRDVALITEMVYGVLRRQRYLDQVIAAFSSRTLDRIEPDLRIVLRLALYQILFLTRIPPHAAVNEAVEMARRRATGRSEGGTGFVNGFLRAVLRDRARVPARAAPAGAADPAASLAVAESHPEWLVRRWASRMGLDQTARLLEAQNSHAPVAMRVTQRAASREEVAAALQADAVDARPSRWLDDFLVASSGAPQRTGCFRRGEIYIQDEASGLVARLVGTAPGDRVLDACAAPGGKAMYLAERAGPQGLVVAVDIHPARVRLVRENAARLGLERCLGLAADLAGCEPPLAPGALFDAVVVDAPCSGTGVIRRNPELRYRLSAGTIRHLAALQARLLSRCAPLVRPGGALVYSVCSLEPEEGTEQVARFLRDWPGFVPDDPEVLLPETARGLLDDSGGGRWLVTLPHRDHLDGFFAARLRRQR